MIEFKDVTLSYGDLKVAENLNVSFYKNSISGILAPSGAGKTSLLNIVAGNVPYDGTVTGVSNGVSYVFQEDRLIPQLTVQANLDFILKGVEPDKAVRYKLIKYYLEMMSLKNVEKKYPNSLSGGEKQRVCLARAFAFPSGVLLLDEPFKALDVKIKQSIMKGLLDVWAKDRRTVLFVTHDVDEAITLSDSIYVFSDKPFSLVNKYNVPLLRGERDLLSKEIVALKKRIIEDIERPQ